MLFPKKSIVRIFTIIVLAIASPIVIYAETVAVFFDSNVAQLKFAAGDVKTALELRGFKVEMNSISALNSKFTKKKIVIALASDVETTKLLTSQGGTVSTNLGEQAYGIRTTNLPQKSYWVL
ncbi:hypothetical protein JZU61_01500, partial [bacterium]|nr:hypothetical protein [bacterium]